MQKRVLVAEQHVAVGNRNDIVMEHALVDHRRVLLREDDALRIRLVKPRYGLRRFQRLARRVTGRYQRPALFAPVDEKLKPRLAVVAAKPVMVGRAFVAEHRHLRQRAVYGKTGLIAENRPQ